MRWLVDFAFSQAMALDFIRTRNRTWIVFTFTQEMAGGLVDCTYIYTTNGSCNTNYTPFILRTRTLFILQMARATQSSHRLYSAHGHSLYCL